jgi:uncharacterized protein YjbJ (UPF0337 family)
MGALDDVKGQAKEVVGSVTGSDDLREEGQAQQKKADHEEEAASARAEAREHEDKAGTHEHAEQKHQGS